MEIDLKGSADMLANGTVQGQWPHSEEDKEAELASGERSGTFCLWNTRTAGTVCTELLSQLLCPEASRVLLGVSLENHR